MKDLNTVDIESVTDNVSEISILSWMEEDHTAQRKFYKYLYLLFGSLIAVSNLSVVIGSGLILKKAVQPKYTYMLLGNISLADTIVGIGLIITAFTDGFIQKRIDSQSHTYINALCIFVQVFRSFPAVVSILTIGAIAIDRYIYIIHCLHYKAWINTRKVQVTIFGIWIVGLTTTAPAWTNIHTIGKCYFLDVFTRIQIVIMITGIISIISAVTTLYSIILMKAVLTRRNIELATQLSKEQDINIKKKRNVNHNKSTDKINIDNPDNFVTLDMKYLQSNSTFGVNREMVRSPISNDTHFHHRVRSSLDFSNNPEQNQELEFKTISETIDYNIRRHPQKECKNNRGVTLVLLTTFSFAVMWTPFILAAAYFEFICQSTYSYSCTESYRKLFRPISALAFCNSLINPFIYAWWHKKYTEQIKKLYIKYFNKTT